MTPLATFWLTMSLLAAAALADGRVGKAAATSCRRCRPDAPRCTLVVTEYTESIYEPDPQVLEFVIEVTGQVAARAATWDAVKQLYR